MHFVFFIRAFFTKSLKYKEGGTQIRTGDKGFAILCLTAWPYHHKFLVLINNNNNNYMLCILTI